MINIFFHPELTMYIKNVYFVWKIVAKIFRSIKGSNLGTQSMKMTHCLSALVESTLEIYSKSLVCKVTLREKLFGFFTSPTILHILQTPRKLWNHWYSLVNLWGLPQSVMILLLRYGLVFGVWQCALGIATVRGNFTCKRLS